MNTGDMNVLIIPAECVTILNARKAMKEQKELEVGVEMLRDAFQKLNKQFEDANINFYWGPEYAKTTLRWLTDTEISPTCINSVQYSTAKKYIELGYRILQEPRLKYLQGVDVTFTEGTSTTNYNGIHVNAKDPIDEIVAFIFGG